MSYYVPTGIDRFLPNAHEIGAGTHRRNGDTGTKTGVTSSASEGKIGVAGCRPGLALWGSARRKDTFKDGSSAPLQLPAPAS
jgi:hypothetical protein